MKSYRLTRGKHYDKNHQPVQVGSIIQLSDARAYALRDRVELVEDAEVSKPEPEPVVLEKVEEKVWLEAVSAEQFASLSAADAIDRVVLEQDVDALISYLDREGRVTVVKAIENRVAELSEGDEEE
jgi:hypothetical protein